MTGEIRLNDEEMKAIKLLNQVRSWLSGREYYLAMRALNFARKRHTGKRKDNVTPEFSHQLHIARFFMSQSKLLRNPERVIILVLLHDTVEDDFASLSDIEQEFGTDIAKAVRLLSKKSGRPEAADGYLLQQHATGCRCLSGKRPRPPA